MRQTQNGFGKNFKPGDAHAQGNLQPGEDDSEEEGVDEDEDEEGLDQDDEEEGSDHNF